MTQKQLVKELINYITNMNEPERTAFLLASYKFKKKPKKEDCGCNK